MTDGREASISHEPRKLGLGCKLLLTGGIALTVLLVALGVLLHVKRLERTRRTITLLEGMNDCLVHTAVPVQLPSFDDGQAAMNRRVERPDVTNGHELVLSRIHGQPAIPPDLVPEWNAFVRGKHVLDAWNHAIYYRCPGPVHKSGWDLMSCGPNGIYEEGGGDDIVVGEDVPGGIAAIESGR